MMRPTMPAWRRLYREVVLKEKPIVAENGFIPLGALMKPQAPKPEVGEPVLGD